MFQYKTDYKLPTTPWYHSQILLPDLRSTLKPRYEPHDSMPQHASHSSRPTTKYVIICQGKWPWLTTRKKRKRLRHLHGVVIAANYNDGVLIIRTQRKNLSPPCHLNPTLLLGQATPRPSETTFNWTKTLQPLTTSFPHKHLQDEGQQSSCYSRFQFSQDVTIMKLTFSSPWSPKLSYLSGICCKIHLIPYSYPSSMVGSGHRSPYLPELMCGYTPGEVLTTFPIQQRD